MGRFTRYERPFATASGSLTGLGHRLWTHRELQRQGGSLRKGEEGGDYGRAQARAAQFWQRAGELHLRQAVPIASHQDEDWTGSLGSHHRTRLAG